MSKHTVKWNIQWSYMVGYVRQCIKFSPISTKFLSNLYVCPKKEERFFLFALVLWVWNFQCFHIFFSLFLSKCRPNESHEAYDKFETNNQFQSSDIHMIFHGIIQNSEEMFSLRGKISVIRLVIQLKRRIMIVCLDIVLVLVKVLQLYFDP